jgi:CRP/FNR family transcriptional regulator, cyclic AMP receptor protein
MATNARIAGRALLEGHYLFGQLAAEDLDGLLAHARMERYRTGQTIFLKGSAGTGMMAVVSGRVRISTPSLDGRELVLNMIHEGEVFGELALLDGKERTADASAAVDCELLVLERRDLLPFLEKHPGVALRLLAIVTGRLRQTTEQVEDVAFLGLESRLAKQLLRLATRHGRRSAGGEITIDAKLSQRELGQMIGLSRESINKQLSAWQREGFVRVEEGTITLLDPDELRRVIESD